MDVFHQDILPEQELLWMLSSWREDGILLSWGGAHVEASCARSQ